MDEFKVGDRVMLSAKLQARLKFPHVGTVEAVNPRVCVTWPNGGQSNERLQDLKLVESAQPETSAAALMSYGAEKAELQRILTKRNATIGRLRAANRELRRDNLRTNKLMLEAQRDADEARFALKRATAEPEPSPLPTVPPRVGGVYRTREGKTATCVSHNPEKRPAYKFWMRLLCTGYEFAVYESGTFLGDRIDDYDLVAEISPPPEPAKSTCETCGDEVEVTGEATCIGCLVCLKKKPPEPAFTGPLEVGGWYEDQDGHTWQCQSIRIDFDSAILATCCRNYDRLIRDFHLDGSPVGKRLKLIRKVDPPGDNSVRNETERLVRSSPVLQGTVVKQKLGDS